MAALGGLLWGSGSIEAESDSASSEGSPVNQRHAWWTSGVDPEPRVGYVGSDLPTGAE